MNAVGKMGGSRYRSLYCRAGVQDNLGWIHAISWMMCEIWQKCQGLIETALGIGVTLGYDVVCHHYDMRKYSQVDDVVS